MWSTLRWFAAQSWFWTERWQQMEQEADADLAAGRVRTY